MSRIDLNISVQHADFKLEVEKSLPLDGLTALFGPSGAGKSTLLRVIAGFERGAGRVVFSGEVWEDGKLFVPPHKRRVATVFQEPRLFDHLDVQGNLVYAARRAGQPEAVTAMLDRFGLASLAARRPSTLSGGEAQRVALARALLTAPRLILMDEPLSALDHARRQEILPYIEELRDNAQIPILYISHSHAEVARLAGQVLSLAGGRVIGFGPTTQILADPALAPGVAGQEPGSLITATVRGMTEDGLCMLDFAGGTILTPEPLGVTGANVRLFIRARDVMLSRERPEGLSALNILPSVVRSVTEVGSASSDIAVDCGGTVLRVRITRRSTAALGLEPGASCHAIVKSVALARD